jgi:hypothetical protein
MAECAAFGLPFSPAASLPFWRLHSWRSRLTDLEGAGADVGGGGGARMEEISQSEEPVI